MLTLVIKEGALYVSDDIQKKADQLADCLMDAFHEWSFDLSGDSDITVSPADSDVKLISSDSPNDSDVTVSLSDSDEFPVMSHELKAIMEKCEKLKEELRSMMQDAIGVDR